MPIDFSQLHIDRQLPISMSRQLYHALRRQILRGEVLLNERLPATRVLAAELSISRQVVVECYAALITDDLVMTFGKGGTRVCYQTQRARTSSRSEAVALSARGERLAQARVYPRSCNIEPRMLEPSYPDGRLFPDQAWLRLGKLAWQSAAHGYQYEGGLPLLKRELRKFLQQYRGIRGITDEQIILTPGTQASLSLLTRLLTNAGDMAVAESPGWGGARAAIHQAGLQLEPVSVDAEGAVLPSQPPAMALLTPTLQFPSGVVMSAARRQAWVSYADTHGVWLVEDDYAAEYCGHQHPPLSLLADFDCSRIIHVGTFAKLFHPGMRVGWMVVPAAIAESVRTASYAMGLQPNYAVQQQLALFIQYGYFAQHLSHTRAVYNERRTACREWLEHHGEGICKVMNNSASGMNLYLRLHPDLVARFGRSSALSEHLAQSGFGVELYHDSAGETYLLLGHSAVDEPVLITHLERLCATLRT